MRRHGLADRADVVALALDGQEHRPADRARIDLPAAKHHLAERQPVFLEHPLHGFEIKFRRQIEHGEIFVVERLGRLAFSVSPLARLWYRSICAFTCRSTFIAMKAKSCMKPG